MNKYNCNVCEANNVKRLHDFYSFEVIECRNCGLVYVFPINENDVAELYHEQYFKNYAENYKDYRLQEFEKQLNTIQTYVPNRGKALDIGCAFGFFLDLMSEKGWKTYGVEISEYAARHIDSQHNVFVGELTEAKFPDNFFDLITIWDTIEHVANPLGLVLEAHRLLREDGLLFVNLPNKDDLFLKMKSTLYKLTDGRIVNLKRHFTHHLYCFSPLTIEKLLSKCGFYIIKMELNVEDLIITNEKGISTRAKVALQRLCHLIMAIWKSKRNEIVVLAKLH